MKQLSFVYKLHDSVLGQPALTAMPRPQLPASVRYFKARFRPFTRPAFWASLSVLSLIGLFAWEAWQHPDWLFKNPEEATPIADTTLSKEDSAVAADIDSLPVLMQELDSADVSIPATRLNQPPQSQGFLDDFLNRQAAEAAKASDDAIATQRPTIQLNTYDPLGVQTQPPSGSDNVSPGGYQATPQNSSTLQTPSVAPANPLQAALDRYAGTNPTTSVQNQTPTNIPGANTNNLGQRTQPGATVPGQVTGAGTQSYPIPAQVAQPASPYTGTSNYSNMPAQVAQPGSPYPGVPYSVAPATGANPVNSYTYLTQTAPVPGAVQVQPVLPPVAPTQGNYGVPTYQNATPGIGVPNGFGASQVQPSQLEPSPFSVPRPVPGRYIGGGQINTFSNP